MLKLSADGVTLTEALEAVRARALEVLAVDGVLMPFTESTPVIATSADENPMVVVTVTYSVSLPPFGFRVDAEGEPVEVELAGLGDKLTYRDETVGEIRERLERAKQPVEDPKQPEQPGGRA